ncbi:MAG: AbrB/MazE/SpoVT family DNA-binding domain-containing protein [Clostridia bacterium]|nr:AbrB/MazE/SpoVT family DNA-binding domain-containing protein [Clostridia bacterium]
MKATGIVRRIDDLGRVVIPKEIRRTMRIREGDPLEIYTDADGEVIFKKYSPIGELSSITTQYADVLFRGTGLPVIVTDRDSVIAVAGMSKKEVLDRRVSRSLENIMENRENFVCVVDGERIKPVEGLEKEAAVAFPIIGGGDVSGALVMLMHENGSCPTQTETKLAQIAASFLGKQMEE